MAQPSVCLVVSRDLDAVPSLTPVLKAFAPDQKDLVDHFHAVVLLHLLAHLCHESAALQVESKCGETPRFQVLVSVRHRKERLVHENSGLLFFDRPAVTLVDRASLARCDVPHSMKVT